MRSLLATTLLLTAGSPALGQYVYVMPYAAPPVVVAPSGYVAPALVPAALYGAPVYAPAYAPVYAAPEVYGYPAYYPAAYAGPASMTIRRNGRIVYRW